MADFHQTSTLTTFHKLTSTNNERIEKKLEEYSRKRPVALVLPSLYSELKGDALKGIIQELKEVKYISEIVVSLGQCSRDEFNHAKEFFSVLPQTTKLIWTDGKKISDVYDTIESAGLRLGEPGKGKAAWTAYGYIIAQKKFKVIALHDCDILTYSREMLARLCFPVVSPHLQYEFCKGFYTRIGDRMYGRVTRLLVTPIIRSLKKVLGHLPLLEFFDSFRYPLAGEFSMDIDIARINKIPADWGLEVGVLSEIYRNCSTRRVCQVDIADNYEHKHQVLSQDDSSKGLLRMCIEICKSIFRTLASEGVIFSDGLFKTLIATYVKTAQDMLKQYEDDAAMNGLIFDRHSESLAVEAFTDGIKTASEIIMNDPLGAPLIPSWDRVSSALPDIMDQINDAVEYDNR
jgi:glucosyl-3-phosphoglycerate synthase